MAGTPKNGKKEQKMEGEKRLKGSSSLLLFSPSPHPPLTPFTQQQQQQQHGGSMAVLGGCWVGAGWVLSGCWVVAFSCTLGGFPRWGFPQQEARKASLAGGPAANNPADWRTRPRFGKEEASALRGIRRGDNLEADPGVAEPGGFHQPGRSQQPQQQIWSCST